MTPTPNMDDVASITSLSDAINVIKFLKVSHRAELAKWKDACQKQAKIIKKLESNRHQELAYLSNQLHKYEFDLMTRENAIAKEIADKNETIDELSKTIESLQLELDQMRGHSAARSDSSDSGIMADHNEDEVSAAKNIKHTPKKRHSSFSKSINFFRKVDFSPLKSKTPKSSSPKKSSSFRKAAGLWQPLEKTSSDDELSSSEDNGSFLRRQHKMNDSMNNHYCEEPSETEREQLFDRVMTRTSVRRSLKNNPKYQKISRNKSKYLEGLRSACEYLESS